jgi:hypothetical protein
VMKKRAARPEPASRYPAPTDTAHPAGEPTDLTRSEQ